jgi:phosphoenolpyruvate-protein phosphotransferase/dihydroxyacetone kinase phosphotransfer subunit
MVGLVVVSHSRALARAAVALAQEMVHGRQPRIAIAAGLDDQTFGTDATQVAEAITSVDQDAGVAVLMDVGSAVLSTELALELLDQDVRERVSLCPAPLVEGLVVAVVTAAGGATREEVVAEATAALAGKTAHLLPEQPVDAVPDEPAPAGELTGTFIVSNAHGLHARPAALLVQEIRRLDARALLRNRTTDSPWVPASSLSKVATLGALHGHEVEIQVSGRQAGQALNGVLALAARGFDQPAETGTPGSAAQSGSRVPSGVRAERYTPLGASPGVGVGPARSARLGQIEVPDEPADDPEAEGRRLQKAIATVRRNTQQLRVRTARELGETEARIFDAHLLLLDDSELLGQVRSRINAGKAAASAWFAAVTELRKELTALPDPYLQARADDVQAVGDQVLRAMLGVSSSNGTRAGVLVAPDITPADVAELERSQVAGVLLAFGSPNGHSAILLRAKGIPAVVAGGPAVLDIRDGTLLAVDGSQGEFVADPAPEIQRVYSARAAELEKREYLARAHAHSPAATRDGIDVLVGANIGTVEDARAATVLGADFAGLVRTEFLFLGRPAAPDVEEQEAIYRDIAEALEGRRMTLRTLDVGGDKPLDFLATPVEANPYLGVRGLRLSLAHPSLIADQLLAIVRVAHDTPVSVMFPMVSTVGELIQARRLLDEAVKQVGRGEPADLEVGIMIEVPATALKAGTFARHVDFLSIGTNDLTQYALAADRNNEAVANIGDPFDPGVLRLIDATCRAAVGQASVAVCGEIAADEHAVALLLGLGVRELSVRPQAVPATKHTVRSLDAQRAVDAATRALQADSADAVREILAPLTAPDSPSMRPAR